MIDPYPLHAALRNLGPVVRLRKYDCWAVSRYLDVKSVVLDWETPASGASVGLANFRNDKPWRVPSIILEADPPLHSRSHKINSCISGGQPIAVQPATGIGRL